MEKERFQELVARALARLPEPFRQHLENVDVLVQDRPTPEQQALAGARGRWELLGLYEGVPQTERGSGYNLVLPDRITLFRRPIERQCHGEAEVEAEIERVLQHEIAHHFGLDDATLEEMER